jgi:branched-chain amino acid transport system substrate-binding protein
MNGKIVLSLVTCLIAAFTGTPASSQNEQFIPVLAYRTGVYAVSGRPFATGEVDYYRLINERDGGINGVKILFEECETLLHCRQV